MIGEMLGTAFDRAVTLFFRSWLVLIVGWAFWFLVSLAGTTPNTKFVTNELGALVWAPLPGLVVAGVSPNAILASGHIYMKVLLGIFVLNAPVILAAGLFVLAGQSVLSNPLLGALVVLSGFVSLVLGLIVVVRCWMVGPAIVLDGRGVIDAFRRSLAVTRKSEWKTLVLISAVVLAIAAITAVPSALVSALLRSRNMAPALEWWGRYSYSALFPLDYYTSLASWLASIKWYEYLVSLYRARTGEG